MVDIPEECEHGGLLAKNLEPHARRTLGQTMRAPYSFRTERVCKTWLVDPTGASAKTEGVGWLPSASKPFVHCTFVPKTQILEPPTPFMSNQTSAGVKDPEAW